MSHALKLSKPRIIFVSPANLKKISGIAQKHSFVEKLISYGNSNTNTMDFMRLGSIPISFDEISKISAASKLDHFECQPQNIMEHVALIMCSSGTTGLPKGVQLTQYNLLVSNAQYQ